jgi:hypothetical protein
MSKKIPLLHEGNLTQLALKKAVIRNMMQYLRP